MGVSRRSAGDDTDVAHRCVFAVRAEKRVLSCQLFKLLCPFGTIVDNWVGPVERFLWMIGTGLPMRREKVTCLFEAAIDVGGGI